MRYELGGFHALKMDPDEEKKSQHNFDFLKKKKDLKNGFGTGVIPKSSTLLH